MKLPILRMTSKGLQWLRKNDDVIPSRCALRIPQIPFYLSNFNTEPHLHIHGAEFHSEEVISVSTTFAQQSPILIDCKSRTAKILKHRPTPHPARNPVDPTAATWGGTIASSANLAGMSH